MNFLASFENGIRHSARLLVFFLLSQPVFGAGLTVADGPITFGGLPLSTAVDASVCADATTGALGKCGSMSGVNPARIAWVAHSGADFTSPIDALETTALDTWCPARSAANGCLLQLSAGVFDLGATPLQMVEFVDIAGSGVATTEIKGQIASQTAGTVICVNNAELRDLKVTNSVTSSYANGIYCQDTDESMRVTRVNVSSKNTAGSAYGIMNMDASPTLFQVTAKGEATNYSRGILNYGSSPQLLQVTAIAEGGSSSAWGIDSTNSTNTSGAVPEMFQVVAKGSGSSFSNAGIGAQVPGSLSSMMQVDASASGASSYGINVTGGTVVLQHAVVDGGSGSVKVSSTGTTLIAHSKLSGAVDNSGIMKCIYVMDDGGSELSVICTP